MSEEQLKEYTVWVGGTEVNDFLLTKEKAEELAESYIEDGYDDVAIDKVDDDYLKLISELS
tara:strand:- start:1004 stop:1186 length:183 start_codon:yes stop_codon:yes gene_type:complete